MSRRTRLFGPQLKVMGNYDNSWISMKRFLGNRSVLNEILSFDSRKITPEIRNVREREGGGFG